MTRVCQYIATTAARKKEIGRKDGSSWSFLNLAIKTFTITTDRPATLDKLTVIDVLRI